MPTGSTLQDRAAILSRLRADARFLRAHVLEHSDRADFARALRDLPSGVDAAPAQRLFDATVASLAAP
eukprot:6673758-Alexandrium_andersonii.AAC.1